MTGLPKLPLRVRFALWVAYLSPTARVDPETHCQIWGCNEWYISMRWPPRLVFAPYEHCIHQEPKED